jgi:hypothetical protein
MRFFLGNLARPSCSEGSKTPRMRDSRVLAVTIRLGPIHFSLLSYQCITSRSLTAAVVRWPISPFLDYSPFLAHACLIRRSTFVVVPALSLSQFFYKYALSYYVVPYFNLTGFYLILDFLRLSPPSLVVWTDLWLRALLFVSLNLWS